MTRELAVGQRIATGDDDGIIDSIDGDRVVVRWGSGIITTQHMDALRDAMQQATDVHPELADLLGEQDAPQAWTCPQEMEQAKTGDYPHGLVDLCEQDGSTFYRVWHDQRAVWFAM